ncbi:hypothetical protein M0R45_032111 [Rubus argutus]|uniref:TIR domain-containing protein n=1 Tax=Rubus argutus TaxID=59490 RepID=A0AAW1WGP7_RUBAR
MASSSASASPAIHQPKEKHDVFLSFRGTDTRKTFTSHLLKALSGKKIETYIDYILESGDEIAPALLKAIEGSKISVITFSENYASSGWCLDELVHILECKEKYGQHVIPIFYGILPSVVRHQTGSYNLEERFKDRSIDIERRLKWKGALQKAADLSGFDSNATTVRDDSDLIEQIVEYLFKKLNYVASSKSKGLVGVERRIQEIESLLRIVPQDDCVRCVGIWGMGGIGKTTLADALYHRLSSHFDGCCFLANVREASWADGKLSKGKLYDLRNKLLCKLLGNESIDIQSKTIDSTTAMQLSRRKVLVVLDDVNDLSQLEMLAGCDVPFGSGSRIIITTRDMQKLRQTKVGDNHDVEIYEVEKLNGDEAHQLLQLNAPRDISSAADSTEVLRKVVGYAEGIPLALNTWRSLVHKGLWDDVKKSLSEDMESIYRVCYDVLRTNEKEIFLDIACFYKGMEINDAKRYLECCRSSVDTGINILIDMSLIALKHNVLWMHDVIQEMGREIVHKQCPEEPGRRTRLCILKDIKHVLEKNTGTAAIQTISIDLVVFNSSFTEMNLTPEVFREMHNLRFLKVDMLGGFLFQDPILRLPQGLESLPQALRYLSWSAYPLKSLPSTFSPDFLVELCMPHSKLQTLWNKGQNDDEAVRGEQLGVARLGRARHRLGAQQSELGLAAGQRGNAFNSLLIRRHHRCFADQRKMKRKEGQPKL